MDFGLFFSGFKLREDPDIPSTVAIIFSGGSPHKFGRYRKMDEDDQNTAFVDFFKWRVARCLYG